MKRTYKKLACLLLLASGSTAFANDLTAMMNNARAQGRTCGGQYYPPAPALQSNTKLWQAAGEHTIDMFQNNYYSHTSQDGRTAKDRIDETGYFDNCRDWSYAENIAAGYDSVAEAFRGWINSPGHCKNIMNPKLKEVGWFTTLGTTPPNPNNQYDHYWVVKFGRCG